MNQIQFKKESVIQSNLDKRIVQGIVYKADTKDAHGQYMSKSTIESMMENFMRLYSNGKAGLDVHHNGITGQAYITKSFINENGDWIIESKIDDDRTWELVKAGNINSFSIEGMGEVKENEILNPYINRISMVERGANGEVFTVVKSDKTLLQKGIDYLQNLIKSDENQPIENNVTIEDRIRSLELAVRELKLLNKNDEETKIVKYLSDVDRERITEIEKINKNIDEKVDFLFGGVSQVSTKNIQKSTSDKVLEQENQFWS